MGETANVHEAATLITTVIPTYRRPTLLRRAIASALAQEGVALHVHVFDNSSGDETLAAVAEIAGRDPRVRSHSHERNIGPAANFEFGLRSVETPFFSILSDDDYLLPGFYSQALNDLAQHPEAMFWAGMTLNVDEHGEIWDARVDRWPGEGLFLPPEGLMAMMHGLSPTWTGIVFRRSILTHLGFPDKEVLGPSDLDFVLRAAASYPFFLRKHPSAVFTLNPESFSATQPLSSFWPGWKKMFQNMEALNTLSGPSKVAVLAALHQDARRMLFRRGLNALSQGRYEFARGAAEALEAEYGTSRHSLLLGCMVSACSQISFLQRAFAYVYRSIERALIRSRADLEIRFGQLIKRH